MRNEKQNVSLVLDKRVNQKTKQESLELGLWEKQSKNGTAFLGGDAGSYWVNIFPTQSTNPKAPQYRLVLREKQGQVAPTRGSFMGQSQGPRPQQEDDVPLSW